MKTLKESILSSTASGKAGMTERIKNYDFTADVIKFLDKTVALYKVKDISELKTIMCAYIKAAGNNCSLNWIDTSEVTSMNSLFAEYDTRKFNGDISKWNVSNVTDMNNMFYYSEFNGNISDWDVSNVIFMSGMFYRSEFNGNISKWDVKNVKRHADIFIDCPIKENYKPKFIH